MTQVSSSSYSSPSSSLDLRERNRNTRCGRWSMQGHVQETGQEHWHYARLGCKRWPCLRCGPKKVKRLRRAVTDCATQKYAQGKGYMKKLLLALEEKLVGDGIKCLYTLARAESVGMNKAFFQLGYAYGGRLVNNCYIYSGIEDMNVWWKSEFKVESGKL